ncbi:MAG TPA: LuxR C-terminal-related transcriptional regulator, partial [Bacteroidia bacterium]
ASKLYLTAIKYAEKRQETELIELYKSYAYECYLTNQITEAILYQTSVFELNRLQNDMEEIAGDLLFLSRLWRLEGNSVKTEKCAIQAIEIMKNLPASKVKGMAFSNISEIKMYAANTIECIEWGEKALAIGQQINDNAIISHALNNMGSALWRQTKDIARGEQLLYKSLSIACEHNLEEDVNRAQINIVFSLIIVKQYNKARSLLTENNLYCEQRNLNTSRPFTSYLEARILFETGNWSEANSIVDNLIKYQVHPEAVRIGALTISAVLKLRKGDPEAENCLVTVKEMAFKTKEYQLIMPVITAILEYEWLSGKTLLSAKELETCFNLIACTDCGTANSEFAFWFYKSRKTRLEMKELYTPYKYIVESKITNAVVYWDELGCPYEKAITLLEGDEENKKMGLMELQKLGAIVIFEKAKKILRAAGIRKIPRGKRASTINNPAHLTNREIEVLGLLQTGEQNKEIASSLFISAKTVDHHISSILLKLDVNSRNKAVAEAVKLGIIKQVN